MSNYTIAAIPTIYRGRKYRSRLEARWAAFFDLLGWRHEYEPFDLGDWSPDFVLLPENHDQCLAEIKPIDTFCQNTARRMQAAAESRAFEGRLLLLGVAPKRLDALGAVLLGWQCTQWWSKGNPTPVRRWNIAPLFWWPEPERPKFFADIPDWLPEWAARAMSNGLFCDGPLHGNDGFAYLDHTMSLWAQATNAVQYQPGART